MSRLIGADENIKLLIKHVENGAQSIMLSGSRNVGKFTTAQMFARSILKNLSIEEMNVEDKWFDSNLMCINKDVTDLTFTNLATVNFEENKSSKEIGVDKVRKVIEFSRLKGDNNTFRIVIIDAVDDLSYSGQNALLKLLEEPPDKFLLLLISHCPSKILPTIRSRCLKLRFANTLSSDLSKWFNDYAPSIRARRRENLIKLGEGKVGKVKLFFEDNIDEYYEKLCNFLAQSTAGAFPKGFFDEINFEDAEERKIIWCSINLLMQRYIYSDKDLSEGEENLFPKIKSSANLVKSFSEVDSLKEDEKILNLEPKQVVLISLRKIIEHIA